MDVQYIIHTVVSLFSLTVLELILGVDNLVFIAVASSQLPPENQKLARRFGLLLALFSRLALLASVSYLSQLNAPLYSVYDFTFSIRDHLLIGGGLFLMYKATVQIHAETEPEEHASLKKHYQKLLPVILQIGLLDIIFSFDSVFTAVGMTSEYWIMATAIIITIIIMIFASEPLYRFIHSRPTIKVLALSFILLIGTLLIADGMHYHIQRGYIYFAICYALFIELLNGLIHGVKTKKKLKLPKAL